MKPTNNLQHTQNYIKIKLDIVKDIILNKKDEINGVFDKLLKSLNVTDPIEKDILTDYCYNNYIDDSLYKTCDKIQKRIENS